VKRGQSSSNGDDKDGDHSQTYLFSGYSDRRRNLSMSFALVA